MRNPLFKRASALLLSSITVLSCSWNAHAESDDDAPYEDFFLSFEEIGDFFGIGGKDKPKPFFIKARPDSGPILPVACIATTTPRWAGW